MQVEDGWDCSRCGAHITKKDREDHEWFYCTICGSQNLEGWFPCQD
nr:MAG TPA: RimK-related lysine biosynthesis protein, Probable-dependent amine/thiol ligase family Amino-group [Caudoviricetes sp.]